MQIAVKVVPGIVTVSFVKDDGVQVAQVDMYATTEGPDQPEKVVMVVSNHVRQPDDEPQQIELYSSALQGDLDAAQSILDTHNADSAAIAAILGCQPSDIDSIEYGDFGTALVTWQQDGETRTDIVEILR